MGGRVQRTTRQHRSEQVQLDAATEMRSHHSTRVPRSRSGSPPGFVQGCHRPISPIRRAGVDSPIVKNARRRDELYRQTIPRKRMSSPRRVNSFPPISAIARRPAPASAGEVRRRAGARNRPRPRRSGPPRTSAAENIPPASVMQLSTPCSAASRRRLSESHGVAG